MIITHKVALRLTEQQRRRLQSLGVTLPAGLTLPGGGEPLVVFDMEEGDPRWDAVKHLLHEWHAGDTIMTRFSTREISSAHWLQVLPEWHHGYPQPDTANFGYLRATYDLAHRCDACGIGIVQERPFQMKAEPKWGRRAILQLNWVFDEYFVTPQVWTDVFQPLGIASRPVMNTKGVELKTVVQLAIDEEVSVDVANLVCETCRTCARPKYTPHRRGFFPRLLREPTRPIVKTAEWFGSGTAANKCVVVSQELARAMTAANLRGASFWPLSSE